MYDAGAGDQTGMGSYFDRAPEFVERARSATAFGSWVTHTGGLSLQMMAAQGFDFLILDTQHGMIDPSDVAGLLPSLTGAAAIPLVRIPFNEPASILRALDGGALGIVCPMVNSADECRSFVAACRYAPVGTRSWGPFRLSMLEPGGYQPDHAAQVLAIAMIETVAAVAQMAEIAAVDGLDALLVGPADLSLSLGHGAQPDWNEPAMRSALERVVSECRANGLLAAIPVGTADDALLVRDLGFDLVAVGSDVGFLAQGASSTLAALDAASAS